MTFQNVDLHFGKSYLILIYFWIFRLIDRAGFLFAMVFINAWTMGGNLLAELTIFLIITEPRW